MIVPIAPQGGMRAISLPGLELLRRHKRSLRIPLPAPGGQELEVWVPLLGAYVVNKASTFMQRQAHAAGGNEKRAKDLLYLRDVAAAGGEVMEHIASDLWEMKRDRTAAMRSREAANMLQLAVPGGPESGIPQAAAMLREREPSFSEAAALADLRGNLADLLDVLVEALDRRR